MLMCAVWWRMEVWFSADMKIEKEIKKESSIDIEILSIHQKEYKLQKQFKKFQNLHLNTEF